jgi:peptidoglycan hydrolase-like protein with peptidoglycan-binding domain
MKQTSRLIYLSSAFALSSFLFVTTIQAKSIPYCLVIPPAKTSSLPSIKQVQIDLAMLHYLPFHLSHQQLVWNDSFPTSLASQWTEGQDNVLYRGALIQFQHQAGISMDGIFGPQTWQELQQAVAHHVINKNGYSYVLVSEALPESLILYHDGKIVLQAPVNTGVPGAITPIGTFPIYLRYLSQTMSGTNVDGSHYDDQGVPYVNYFSGGCAVHGFPRIHYGYPQSLGCIELPIPAAKMAWNDLNYGDLVTVTASPIGKAATR